MKNFNKQRLNPIIVLLLIFIGLGSCEFYDIHKSDDIPMLRLSDTIVHPPDTFKIAFPMQANSYSRTGIIFDTTSTWLIKKLNTQSNQINILDGETDSLLYKMSNPSDSYLFHKETFYYLSCQSNHQDGKNMVVYFEKQIR